MPSVAITGTSRGIGLAIAQRFLAGGWDVLALQRSADGVAALGPRATHVPFDAQDEASVVAAAAAVATAAPSLSALVNNAGIALSAPLHRTSAADWQRVQAVNSTAPFLLCQALVPGMAQRGAGRVVNVTSTAARKGFKYTAAYCASKHALLGLTRALAVELAAKGVTVNAVSPGWTETKILEDSLDKIAQATGKSKAEAKQALVGMNPMGRAVRPAEVAELVFFLCDNPGAAAITGAEYLIDAGETV